MLCSVLYKFSLFLKVLKEMPKILAAWVRLPKQWSKVPKISVFSTSATVAQLELVALHV